jgi:hypothetical protein
LCRKLDARDTAHFKRGKDNTCLNGTRVDLCRRIEEWIETRDTEHQRKLFWLHGKAESGKSTVANTVASMAQRQGYLLSCFCKRDDPYLSDSKHVLPALAFNFAEQHDSYRVALMQSFHGGSGGVGIVETTDISTQLEQLFAKLLPSIADPCRPHVVVIDALDECGSNPKERRELAHAAVGLSSVVPWIKVFLTSRDEAGINTVLRAGEECTPCDINDETEVDHDVERYISAQLNALDLQLSGDHIRQLAQRGEGRFIWCSTLFRYLNERVNPRDALNDFLHGDKPHGSLAQLDALYHQVLESAAKHPEDMASMRVILGTISLTSVNPPLSIAAIWSFLDGYKGEQLRPRSEGQVRNLVKGSHAVLFFEGSEDGAVRAYHTSFYDFLGKQFHTGANWLGKDNVDLQMLRRSLEIMHEQLRFNICKLDNLILNQDVADLDRRIHDNISEELRYSSSFWSTHLLPSHFSKEGVCSAISSLLGTE